MQSSSGEKMEVIMKNPWLVKAGIPLLLSAAAFISAKILSNRASPVSPVLEEEDEEEEEEEEEESSPSSPATEMKDNVVEVLEDLKRREYELEMRFLIYQDTKEKESMVMEIRNKLCLEMTQLQFLVREASLMEAEARRMGEMMVEYLKVVKKLETSMWEKGLDENKAKKLRRRVREMSKVVREQSLCLKARDEEILSNQRELVRKSEVIVELENEISMIKGVVDQFKEQKIELLNKLEMVERSAVPKPKNDEEDEVVTKEVYDKVVEELESVEKDRAAKENELIYLRWSNACLRHDLTRCQEQQRRNQEEDNKNCHSELESEVSVTELAETSQDILHDVDCDGLCLGPNNEGSSLTEDGRFSRRKKFMRKLRKWVEGGKMDEKQKHEEMNKCFGRHSVALSEEADENYVRPRNSFSSA